MPISQQIPVKNLVLDLKNFRTTPQKNEENAIKAMIAISPHRFHAIMESILDDGYLLTENIQVLRIGKDKFEVREGNRRIAALKIILGLYKKEKFLLTDDIVKRIEKISKDWKKENGSVPCTVFEKKEIDMLNKIVRLTHAKGEQAGRDPWNSVAKARYERDFKHSAEYGLDLLEKYLVNGQNITTQQKDRWGGDYPLSVLDEALRKLHERLGYSSVVALVKAYPKIKSVSSLDDLLRDIGTGLLTFPIMRNPNADFGIQYGFNPPVAPTQNQPAPLSNSKGASNNNNRSKASGSGTKTTGSTTSNVGKAYSTNDPKSVTAKLKGFIPKGKGREKIVTLRDELLKLKLDKNPIAFCFLLRSMFEISAVIYCKDKTIPLVKIKNGKNGPTTRDKTLSELLSDVTAHLIANNSNKKAMTQTLHGAKANLTHPDNLLSVTSMNQLVHNNSFSVSESDISKNFNNIFPLLAAMN